LEVSLNISWLFILNFHFENLKTMREHKKGQGWRRIQESSLNSQIDLKMRGHGPRWTRTETYHTNVANRKLLYRNRSSRQRDCHAVYEDFFKILYVPPGSNPVEPMKPPGQTGRIWGSIGRQRKGSLFLRTWLFSRAIRRACGRPNGCAMPTGSDDGDREW
jgi:hypothetical protein